VSGLAHWSIGDRPANVGSVKENRVVPSNSELHPSIKQRMSEKKVPIRKQNEIVFEAYKGLDWRSKIYVCETSD
jgi:hypothetical protein